MRSRSTAWRGTLPSRGPMWLLMLTRSRAPCGSDVVARRQPVLEVGSRVRRLALDVVPSTTAAWSRFIASRAEAFVAKRYRSVACASSRAGQGR